MKIYEYKILWLAKPLEKHVEKTLNEHGKVGWKIISIKDELMEMRVVMIRKDEIRPDTGPR